VLSTVKAVPAILGRFGSVLVYPRAERSSARRGL